MTSKSKKKTNEKTFPLRIKRTKSPALDWDEILKPVLPLRIGKPAVVPTPPGEDTKLFRRKLYQVILVRLDGLKEGISKGDFSLVVRDNPFGAEDTTEIGVVRKRGVS